MSAEIYNLWSLIVNIFGAVIALGVAMVIFWYTRETQRLRKESERQTVLMQAQLRVSQNQSALFAEQVLSAIRPFVLCEISDSVPGGTSLPLRHPLRAIKTEYRGNVWNPTDRVAHDLRVLIHERSTGYYWSDEPPVLKKEGESTAWTASGALDEDRALRLAEAVYGPERMGVQRAVLQQYSDQDYVAVFFRDINGNVYASFSLITNPVAKDYRLRLTQILRPAG
jgi:hypothetical protein